MPFEGQMNEDTTDAAAEWLQKVQELKQLAYDQVQAQVGLRPAERAAVYDLLSKFENAKTLAEQESVELEIRDTITDLSTKAFAKPKTADNKELESAELSEAQVDAIVEEKLSYQDAELPPERLQQMAEETKQQENARNYARALNTLDAEELSEAVSDAKTYAATALSALGVESTAYGKSDSWAYWDFAKQQHLYEQNKDKEPDPDNPYVYEPAMEKRVEVADRHVGWEFFHSGEEAIMAVVEKMDRAEQKALLAAIEFGTKADGQLRSFEYAKLGSALREFLTKRGLLEESEAGDVEADSAAEDSWEKSGPERTSEGWLTLTGIQNLQRKSVPPPTMRVKDMPTVSEERKAEFDINEIIVENQLERPEDVIPFLKKLVELYPEFPLETDVWKWNRPNAIGPMVRKIAEANGYESSFEDYLTELNKYHNLITKLSGTSLPTVREYQRMANHHDEFGDGVPMEQVRDIMYQYCRISDEVGVEIQKAGISAPYLFYKLQDAGLVPGKYDV